MKKIGYISGNRIKGAVDLGDGGNLIVPGTTILALQADLYGPALLHSSLAVAGNTLLGAPVICSSSVGVAGPLTVAAALIIPGIPVADPHVGNQLWDNAGVVNCSHG